MKMAKPSENDINAAGDLIGLLTGMDQGCYPSLNEDEDTPDYFDEDDPGHLRAFYDAVKATLNKSPGYPGRVIGGMCYVIMFDQNEIIDPDSEVIELHPKLVEALKAVEAKSTAAPDDVRDKQRLDWLDQNIFHREMDEFDQKLYGDHNMWVMFSPKGTQGTARNIIDAATVASAPSTADSA